MNTMAEITELERQFHRWLKDIAPELREIEGPERLGAFAIKLLFGISRQLDEIKKAITSARSAEVERPAKLAKRKPKPRQ